VEKLFKYILIFLPLLLILGCDKGIVPASVEEEQQKAGFSGTITFSGTWPDSVKNTILVVFINPLNSPASFSVFNVGYISHPIPYGVTKFDFSTMIDSGFVPIQAGTYSYVAVAQSKKAALSLNRSDWVVAGIYYVNGDTSSPGKLDIPPNTLVKNVNIICDFNNPPPQPPGGN
jgi:hypothetical protein